MIIGFDNRRAAQSALDDLEAETDRRDLRFRDLALLFRDDHGRSKVRRTSRAGTGNGLLPGGVLGLLVGITAPVGAVAAAVAGGALGGVITGIGDESVDNEMMRSLALAVEHDEAVVMALADRSQLYRMEDSLSPYADRLEYLAVPQATVDLINELSKLSMEDLENS
ncbi:MAG: DUF1269 domain-containing protein [Acidimicrobiales bacterium]